MSSSVCFVQFYHMQWKTNKKTSEASKYVRVPFWFFVCVYVAFGFQSWASEFLKNQYLLSLKSSMIQIVRSRLWLLLLLILPTCSHARSVEPHPDKNNQIYFYSTLNLLVGRQECYRWCSVWFWMEKSSLQTTMIFVWDSEHKKIDNFITLVEGQNISIVKISILSNKHKLIQSQTYLCKHPNLKFYHKFKLH